MADADTVRERSLTGYRARRGRPTGGRMSRSAAATREHVLAVASELFYWNGIRATGIDRVAAEAGVAPTTLYRVFASKDDLIGAYIERADRLYREWFETAARAGGRSSRCSTRSPSRSSLASAAAARSSWPWLSSPTRPTRRTATRSSSR